MSRVTLTNMVLVEDLKNGKVLVQDRIKSYPGIAFPGGHVEDGESIYDSAIREIKEETGYDIVNLKYCGFIYWDNKDSEKYFTYFYKTSDYSGNLVNETLEGKVFWIDLNDLEKMKLAPNMNIYLKMLISESYSECYCGYRDGYIPRYMK